MPLPPVLCRRPLPTGLLILSAALGLTGTLCGVPSGPGDGPIDLARSLEACNVVWRELGRTASDSMPLGNGDISLNVWTEQNGDAVFYIGKTDAWTEDPEGSAGLAKLGRIRVSIKGHPLQKSPAFVQELKLLEGEIELRAGDGQDRTLIRLWVDADHPVVRVEVETPRPESIRVSLEPWRTVPAGRLSADTILNNPGGRIVWYHHNGAGADPHVMGWTFGGAVGGAGLRVVDPKTLESSAPSTFHLISIYPLTTRVAPVEAWAAEIGHRIDEIGKLDLEATRREHQKWWDAFWHRSWIFLEGPAGAGETTEGYILQRFVTACAGRGAFPIKFNGSTFVVDRKAEEMPTPDHATKAVTADFRWWGGRYWFQNTRAMYWPRLMAGDFDEMLPLFRMYREMLPTNAALVQQYYHHEGAYCAEVSPFWGGLKDLSKHGQGYYVDHYYTDLLELSMMGLDYYEYTGDEQFARDTLVPIANAIVTFFDRHFPRDSEGRLLLDPDNALETYWKVRNPAPDLAGLHAVLPRLAALPQGIATAPDRAEWQRVQAEVPDLPLGASHGRRVLLPYQGDQTAVARNLENPELYAVYPFRLYGLGKPDLGLARDTFALRTTRSTGCWFQDPIQAAMLGLTGLAQKDVVLNFTRKDPHLKFPAFWEGGWDYMPDEDNGGNAENALQQMLLQANGRELILLPAWPRGWNADFKLNAPFRTTLEGRVRSGKLVRLLVTPSERQRDVRIMPCSD